MTNPTGDDHIPQSLSNDGDALLIEWSDGVRHRLSWNLLRNMCPCASCRLELTNPQPTSALPVLRPEEAQPIKPLGMQPVGNYAYRIAFSDSHDTGIYSLEYLRELGEKSAKTRE